jgi:dCMP deaminase
MGIAFAVRQKANCTGRKVGAVLVKENRIISTGYNGTPEGMTNCLDGGCERCRDKKGYASSVGYDVCICVHAEQNALITAARFGIPIQGSIMYSTLRPCFDCSKAMLQAKVHTVYYLHDWSHPIDSLQKQYQMVQKAIPGGVQKVYCEDKRADWANGIGE